MPPRRGLFRRAIALPGDHGSWVFLLSPLTIGLAVGGRWTTPVVYLVVASLCGFLSRQPMTIAVKALTGRRSRGDLWPALFWSAAYGFVGLVHVLGLFLRGFGYILYLAIPGLAVYVWYLVLVARRGERNQVGLELVGAGVLALTAPAGLWAGLGYPDRLGWLLWALTWAQSAASIVFVYLRLGQRHLPRLPGPAGRFRMGLPALTLTSLNVLAVGALGVDGLIALPLFVAYLPQWLETLWAIWNPTPKAKPTAIGIRQLAVSVLYTVLFIWAW